MSYKTYTQWRSEQPPIAAWEKQAALAGQAIPVESGTCLEPTLIEALRQQLQMDLGTPVAFKADEATILYAPTELRRAGVFVVNGQEIPIQTVWEKRCKSQTVGGNAGPTLVEKSQGGDDNYPSHHVGVGSPGWWEMQDGQLRWVNEKIFRPDVSVQTSSTVPVSTLGTGGADTGAFTNADREMLRQILLWVRKS